MVRPGARSFPAFLWCYYHKGTPLLHRDLTDPAAQLEQRIQASLSDAQCLVSPRAKAVRSLMLLIRFNVETKSQS